MKKHSGTIEINHSNIVKKIKKLEKAFSIINNIVINEDNIKGNNKAFSSRLNYISKIYQDVKENYDLDVINILSDYYDLSIVSNDVYEQCIDTSNYDGKLINCISSIEKLVNFIKNKETKLKIIKIINIANKYQISNCVTENKFDICTECGNKMTTFSEFSELRCETKLCGFSKKLYGTIFEDTQIYSQEGQRTKHGIYDPARHCKFWVNRIQAKEKKEIPEQLIKNLKLAMIRDSLIDKRKIKCFHIRMYLKELNCTDYNDHIPLIRKIITDKSPPHLKEKEIRKLYNYFNKAVDAFDIVKLPTQSNTPYYPYFIYKIIDQILENGLRKILILECIHLQSRETLISNDKTWKKICKVVEELNYKPTDRNEQSNYIT